ncbi:MAG: RNA polymerase sigma factor [Steroidobacteraceae bacterium]
MTSTALGLVFRDASGRIVAALASRFRDLDLAEDSFAAACARALEAWSREGPPRDAAAWLYQTAYRCAVDTLRRRRTEHRFAPELQREIEQPMPDEWTPIPDERLRLIFVCCHPAVAPDARAALTLRLVCGLSTREIARAFLLAEPTLAQRLIRAKRKIAAAGVSFEVPGPQAWPERLDAVLSTIEIAYGRAHEDAAGSGPHCNYAAEMLDITRVLAELLPHEAETSALAAIVRFAEARRPARVDAQGMMIPLAHQDPGSWIEPLIVAARHYLDRAVSMQPRMPRVLQARIHAAWCARRSLAEPPPWPQILTSYDELLEVRDDSIVRLNRAVALAEVQGAAAGLAEIEALATQPFDDFLPYHAVRADLLRRVGRRDEARIAYDAALALVATSAERLWMERQRAALTE